MPLPNLLFKYEETKMRKKFLGLAVIAIAALCVMACDTYTNAAPIDCALVGEWESVNIFIPSSFPSFYGKLTIKFGADGKFTTSSFEAFGLSSGIEYYAKITDFGYVTLLNDKDEQQSKIMRYYFSGNKLYLDGTAYERKN